MVVEESRSYQSLAKSVLIDLCMNQDHVCKVSMNMMIFLKVFLNLLIGH